MIGQLVTVKMENGVIAVGIVTCLWNPSARQYYVMFARKNTVGSNVFPRNRLTKVRPKGGWSGNIIDLSIDDVQPIVPETVG